MEQLESQNSLLVRENGELQDQVLTLRQRLLSLPANAAKEIYRLSLQVLFCLTFCLLSARNDHVLNRNFVSMTVIIFYVQYLMLICEINYVNRNNAETYVLQIKTGNISYLTAKLCLFRQLLKFCFLVKQVVCCY